MTFIIFIFFVPILVGLLLIINTLFAPSRPDNEKNSSYESGFMAITGQTRTPFSIIYYLVAILFLVFDLEIMIMIPFASCMYILGSYGFWILVLFFFVLTFGFIVEISMGVINFTDNRSAITIKNVNN